MTGRQNLKGADRTSLVKGACPEQSEGGQAHRGSLHDKEPEFKRGLKKTPFEFWLPGQDSNLQPSG
jgi:hypothetical protein